MKKFWRQLKLFIFHIFHPRYHHRPKISLLIPFSSKSRIRKHAFKWLLQYYRHQLPNAEIIVGHSHSKIFCKGRALNDAAKKATGRVLVILDADTYMSGKVIERCANRILQELENNLWYVPYRYLYRLNKRITDQIIFSDPSNPLCIPSPPPPEFLDDKGNKSMYGHRYGAMVMIFPREALDTLGCFDERFKGWGGEDIALLRALDTLYGKHKTTDNDILHLWHPFIGGNYQTRTWEGQKHGSANNKLANEYNRATRNPAAMRKLVDKGCRKRRK